AEAVTGFRALAAGQPAPGVVSPQTGRRAAGTVFVYSGQGSQWAGMGRQLLADEPAFAAAVAELEPVFVQRVGFSLRQVLESGEPVVGIDRIQPVLVGVQLALTELWRAHGVEPDAVIGHSMGEVTAAVVAGALTPADGLRVIATRSRLMARLSGQGAMALLELNATATEKLIADYPDITLAVYASPHQSVIAGPPEQVDAVVAIVDGQGKLARRVEVDVASHHPTVDPILSDLRSALSDLMPTSPKISLISTTGHTGGEPTFDAGYWVANLRNPVRFSQAVAAAGAEHGTFVEVSPHPLLTHAITESLESAKPRGDVHVGATLYRDNPDTLTFYTQLAAARPPVADMPPVSAREGRLADIPPTPWLRSHYWVADRSASRGPAGAHPLLGVHVEMPSTGDHVWQSDVGTDALPWLADHKVHGQPVLPAAAFAEIALAAGSEALGRPVQAVEVNRLEVEQMLPLDAATQVTTQLSRGADNSVRVEVHSRSAGGNWTRHAVARVDTTEGEAPAERPASLAGSGSALSPADFYSALRRTGAHHGQAFAALTRIVRSSAGAAEAEIALPDEASPDRNYRIHPVLLDAALQTLAAAMPGESLKDSAEVTYLPVSLESIRLFGDVGRRARCRADVTSVDDGGAGATGRVTLMDQTGAVTAQVNGIFLRRIQRRTVPLPLSQKVFDTVWLESPGAATDAPAPTGSWLVLAGDSDAAALARDFTAGFGAPTRRVISGDLTDESAVLEAFAQAAADPDLPPAGVILFLGGASFDGTDTGGALTHARDSIWAISTVARAIVSGWHGKSPRLWLVSRNGLAVNRPQHGPEHGNPAVGAVKGLIRVLAYEHPDLHATLIDLDKAEDT
ncbi:MAG: phthiocerol/phenolphthiocerol synthesis type-I polyketide synthase, partial [Solirubrobacteraceae bacterium]|nr:phthiocerol/phenolphthiocerol synthesis type-I polyketide synthase [Solirubrobacteraceae bacterium]